MKRTKNRFSTPGDCVEITGESAKQLKLRDLPTKGVVEDTVRETVWVRLSSGKLVGVADSDVQIIKTDRAANPKKLKTTLLK